MARTKQVAQKTYRNELLNLVTRLQAKLLDIKENTNMEKGNKTKINKKDKLNKQNKTEMSKQAETNKNQS